MTGENSLALMTRASAMLAEADTIQKAKDLKDLALTAADWAKRKGLGQEAIQHARSYALRAEIKMGEMLEATKPKRAKPPSGKGQKKTDRRLPTGTDDAPTLAEMGLTKKESMNAQRLAAMPKARQEEIIRGEASRSKCLQSESNEWWTPPEYIEAARRVLGGFDLDPASCAAANETVKAEKIYTAKEDGLTKEWIGKVWLNPPYGGLQADFTRKLLESEKVTAAILLVNSNSTDTDWFAPLFDCVLCFTDHRIDFTSPENKANNSTHGSVFAYIGKHPDKFYNEFKEFGHVVRKYK